jgi:cytochrome b
MGDETTNTLNRHMSALDILTQKRMPSLRNIRAYFLNYTSAVALVTVANRAILVRSDFEHETYILSMIIGILKVNDPQHNLDRRYFVISISIEVIHPQIHRR